jgi:CRISPR-associated protein (Cas_APE2256)
VHLLPCGVSILRNMRPPKPVTSLAAADIRAMTGWAHRELTPTGRDDPDRWTASFRDEVGPYLDAIRGCQEPVKLSAEVACLHRHAPQPTAGDQLVLLASDTADGVLAALLNAARLRHRVVYHPEPLLDSTAAGRPVLDEGTEEPLHILRIPGLLPDSTERFSEAMAHVAKAMVWAAHLHRRKNEELMIHLAGGYKATIPYLVALAEYVLAAWPPVRAWCLHEGDADDNPAPQPVVVGLRRVSLGDDLGCLKEAQAGRLPDDERLHDFAYTDDGGRAALTPIGHALACMVPYLRGSG